ncbi:MAG: pyridoxal phosphate-dependent aminotransferase, partial [Gammaproteobacteria bacterium]
RPRILILSYPSNPTGMTYTEIELAALARVARRYGIVLLSDEIYGELTFDGRHRTVANYYPEGTIISSGLSKWCGAGGWRIGTFLFPPELRWLQDAMAVVASESFTSVSAPIQHAAVIAFQQPPEVMRYLEHSRAIQGALARHVTAELRSARLDLPDPEGGFYLFVDFSAHRERLESRGVTSGELLCNRLLEEGGVAILPGSAFGRSRRELSARLALVDFDGARALRAAAGGQAIDDQFVEQHCWNVVEAARRIRLWLDA